MAARTYYQYYTNVTHRTCPECLSWHGRIAEDEASLPNRDDGCARRLLAFHSKDLAYYREQECRMRAAAEAEVARRTLLADASVTLEVENEVALSLFGQAAQIDLHVAEVEALCIERKGALLVDPALRERLRALLVRAYSDKFGHPRYERLPEAMRLARERAGVERINELLR